MTDRQTSQQVKSEGVQRTLKDTNPTAAPIKLYLVGEERRSGNCYLDNTIYIIMTTHEYIVTIQYYMDMISFKRF